MYEMHLGPFGDPHLTSMHFNTTPLYIVELKMKLSSSNVWNDQQPGKSSSVIAVVSTFRKTTANVLSAIDGSLYSRHVRQFLFAFQLLQDARDVHTIL